MFLGADCKEAGRLSDCAIASKITATSIFRWVSLAWLKFLAGFSPIKKIAKRIRRKGIRQIKVIRILTQVFHLGQSHMTIRPAGINSNKRRAVTIVRVFSELS